MEGSLDMYYGDELRKLPWPVVLKHPRFGDLEVIMYMNKWNPKILGLEPIKNLTFGEDIIYWNYNDCRTIHGEGCSRSKANQLRVEVSCITPNCGGTLRFTNPYVQGEHYESISQDWDHEECARCGSYYAIDDESNLWVVTEESIKYLYEE